MTTYNIAVVHGDGIGPEVCSSAVEVLRALPIVGSVLRFIEYPGGANEYLRSGSALPKATLEGCRGAHAILHGATGIPGVTYADGTETGIEFGLQLRFSLDLYANVRPIRLRPGVRSRLAERPPGSIDYVIVRENTEGLYAARGAGVVLRDETAVDSLVITRKGTERICRFAFELARGRNGAPGDSKKRVTCCDKANVLGSSEKRFSIEEAHPDFWRKYFGLQGAVIGIDRFGESAPAGQLQVLFGFTVSNVVKTAKELLS